MGQPVENAVIGAGTRTGTRLRFATPQGWLPPLDWCDNYGVAVMGDYICINWPIFFCTGTDTEIHKNARGQKDFIATECRLMVRD